MFDSAGTTIMDGSDADAALLAGADTPGVDGLGGELPCVEHPLSVSHAATTPVTARASCRGARTVMDLRAAASPLSTSRKQDHPDTAGQCRGPPLVPDRTAGCANLIAADAIAVALSGASGPAGDRVDRPSGVSPLSKKLPALLVALALLAALPGVAIAQTDRATLIDVHGIHVTKAKPGGGANCSNDGASNGLYELTGWQVQGPKTARLNTNTVPSGLTNVPGALQASFNAWRGVEPNAPQITVATGGTVTKPTANHSYDLMWGRTGGNTIAVTYTWQWSNGEIESDVLFNTRLAWFTASSEGDGCDESQAKFDVRNIATHEFGHVYGLGHPGDDRFETMYAYGFTGETLKWSPENGDDAGMAEVY